MGPQEILLIIVLISSIIIPVSIISLIIRKSQGRSLDYGWDVACWIFIIIFTLFGLTILPLAVSVQTHHQEITNYDLVKTQESVIIDLVNSPERNYIDLYKFDRYRSVMGINDSTKFLWEKDKSFYGMTTDKRIVWSNPPYEIYNRK